LKSNPTAQRKALIEIGPEEKQEKKHFSPKAEEEKQREEVSLQHQVEARN
jgi:hypothetical protein